MTPASLLPLSHYCDLVLRPDPEFAPETLMSSLFGALHLALVRSGLTTVGASFPEVAPVAAPVAPAGRAPAGPGRIPAISWRLGSCLRLHGSGPDLQHLMEFSGEESGPGARPKWLRGLSEAIDSTRFRLRPVPAGEWPHRSVHRVQPRPSGERWTRRYLKRHGVLPPPSLTQGGNERLDLPFVSLRSSSSGQLFLLFIEHGELLPQPAGGAFNTYGLSVGASVPWFP